MRHPPEEVAIANTIVMVAAVYAVAGALFAVMLLARGLRVVDPVAADGSVGFKLLILPGVIALWPVILRRWIARRRSSAA